MPRAWDIRDICLNFREEDVPISRIEADPIKIARKHSIEEQHYDSWET
jgi:hypothetical protein